MRSLLKFVAIIAAIIAAYIGFLLLSHIDETVTEGEAYSFRIGMDKEHAFSTVKQMTRTRPDLVLHIAYGHRAGDTMTLEPVDTTYLAVSPHDRWWLLIDGPGRHNNTIRLDFIDGRLAMIQRRRMLLELH